MSEIDIYKTTVKTIPNKSGMIILGNILIVVAVLSLIISGLFINLTLSNRSTTANKNNRISNYASEAAIYDTIQRINKSEYSWPGKNNKVEISTQINGVTINLEVNQDNFNNVIIKSKSKHNSTVNIYEASIYNGSLTIKKV